MHLAITLLLLATDNSPLFEAIRNNDEKSVATLLGTEGVDANAPTAQGATLLMQAAIHASPSIMNRLIDRGADPNARNPFGATALMWAAGDAAKVRVLLEHGADVNAKSNSGRTALTIAAAYAGNLDTLRLLLAKGADAKAVDVNGDGPLGNAASSADVEMIRALLAAGASVEERGSRGPSMRKMTPLMRAASANCVACVRLLLERESDVNAVSAEPRAIKAGLQELGKMTSLLLAAQWGNPDLVRPLLAAGASLETADSRGLTPLMAAITAETQDARTVELLLEKGARGDVRALDGQTPLSWAHKWGRDTPIAKMIGGHGGLPGPAASYVPPKPKPSTSTPSAAIERSLALLLASNTTFFQKGGCVGCHHQMMTGLLVGQARKLGLKFDAALAQEQLKTAVTVSQPSRESALQRIPGGGAPLAGSLLLASLAAQGYPPDAFTDALVHEISGLQRLDGSWLSMSQRPPLEAAGATETAYAIRALRQYGSPGRRAEMDRRIGRARSWLLTAETSSTEERVMQILGLHWAGASSDSQAAWVKALLAEQKPDGGWAQRPGLSSDAYATGQTLYALRIGGGIPVGDPAVRRGVQYLLGTQYEDGSWYVASRSVKFQPYFQSGFPHEHDQWISAAATVWAGLGLAVTMAR